MKVYFNGCSGVEKPVDLNGNEIKIGDKLTWDFGGDREYDFEVQDWMKKPIFEVQEHKSGNGLCAVGIHKKLYLHDFRFKYCEVINT